MPLVLIVSPIRSWPVDQGNRARVFKFGQMFRERGFSVHFLLSGLESRPTEQEITELEKQWDLVHTLPYTHDRVQSYADAWGGDDWYDPSLDDAIRELTSVWDYDACVVNYAWYSKAFEVLPSDTVRIIDTHDAFGDRHLTLYAAGTTPAWYYTRKVDEARCFSRADIVVAIQDEEKAAFEALTDKTVITIGHVTAPQFQPARRTGGEKFRVGYLASGNPSNQTSLIALLEEWSRSPYLCAHTELHLAGSICKSVSQNAPPYLIKHGFVPEPMDFYKLVDVIVNPNIGGSGLKIKSIEALGFGRPLFATEDGMLGICSVQPPYVSKTVSEMTAQISKYLSGNTDLLEATSWAKSIFLDYRQIQISAFNTLCECIDTLRTERIQHQSQESNTIEATYD